MELLYDGADNGGTDGSEEKGREVGVGCTSLDSLLRILPARLPIRPTAQIPAQRAPDCRAAGSHQRDQQRALAKHVQQRLGPAAQRIAAAINHRIDEIL